MTLPERLLADGVRPAVVADCEKLIDDEVQKKKGVSGLAIKGGYKVVKRLDGGTFVAKAVNDLLPEFAVALEPFHAQHRAAGHGTFLAFATGREGELSDALLGVTDGKAEHAKNKVLKNIYYKLRPSAKRNLEASLPALARVIDVHAP